MADKAETPAEVEPAGQGDKAGQVGTTVVPVEEAATEGRAVPVGTAAAELAVILVQWR